MQALLLLLITLASTPVLAETRTAIFAGGCFWCVEAAYQDVEGVVDAVSGFTGGTLRNPTYSGNHKGHYEAVKVTYDSDVISYEKLLDIFWTNIDPFDSKGQFCDKGDSYLSALFYADEKQRQLADASKQHVETRFPDREVVTPVLASNKFWPVEEYHQDYYKKNPLRYAFYKHGCGRDARLKQIWGDDQDKY